ncbi:MAG: hypothetical protein KC466_05285, partial [Myxococcales bacterium]|nr:hypothetical protein [Myxococcales bacterium]
PTGSFSAGERAKFIEFAKGQYEYLKKHPYWNSLKLVIFTPAGEWRKYSLGSNSFAADWIALIKDLRAAIPDRKVWIAFNFSDSAAFEQDKANNWNAPTYEALCNIPGVVGDRHYYRPSRSDVHSVLNAGLLEEPFMAVSPNQWSAKSTRPCPFIVKEFAVSGAKGGDRRNKTWNYPWFVAMGFMDLLRSSMRSGALVNMAWQWMPEDIPNEWPYGLTTPDGRLQPAAVALSSITPILHGQLSGFPEDREIRCVTTKNGRDFGMWCGNFSQQARTLTVRAAGGKLGPAKLTRLVDSKFSADTWNGQTPVAFKPLEMIRFDF